jgi:hypothetical protein
MSIVLPEQSFNEMAAAIAQAMSDALDLHSAALRSALGAGDLSPEAASAVIDRWIKHAHTLAAISGLLLDLAPVEPAARRALSALKVPA